METHGRWRVSPAFILSRPSSSFQLKNEFRLGGMCGAIVTSPLDVVKTRLQSDMFREKHASVGTVVGNGGGGMVVIPRRPGLFYNFVETVHIVR